MNDETARWSLRYQKALRKHLGQGPGVSLRLANELGRDAVGLGLETLDVTRIHEQALTTVLSAAGSPRTRQKKIERARRFFAEAIVPIEQTHRAALKAGVRLKQLTRTLCLRTREASSMTRHLKRGVARRQVVEAALRKSGERRAMLLAEAQRLQRHLRQLTREILSAQEAERQKTSRKLHDEIAQTLLAISVRLLTLRNAAKVDSHKLTKEIAETQRLVRQSSKTMHRVAHEFKGYHEK